MVVYVAEVPALDRQFAREEANEREGESEGGRERKTERAINSLDGDAPKSGILTSQKSESKMVFVLSISRNP